MVDLIGFGAVRFVTALRVPRLCLLRPQAARGHHQGRNVWEFATWGCCGINQMIACAILAVSCACLGGLSRAYGDRQCVNLI